MSEGPDDLVFNMLGAMRAEQAEQEVDLLDIKERVGSLEGGDGSISRRTDRFAGDVDLGRRRLEPSDTTAS